jgi:hypothetical protein
MLSLPEDFDRELLAEAFLDMPTPHGATFDDLRRWCGKCEEPVVCGQPSTFNTWADKICPRCTAIWPEHIDLFQMTQMMADDEDEDVYLGMMH